MLYEKIDSKLSKNDEDGVISLLSDIPTYEQHNILCILEISLYKDMRNLFSHIVENYDLCSLNKPSESLFDAIFQRDFEDMESFTYYCSTFLSKGLDIYQLNNQNDTFIENIIFSENTHKYEMLDFLLEKGIEIRSNPCKDKTLLTRTSPYKNLFKYLFDKCPNLILEKSKKDNSFFITCIQNKKYELVSSIIEREIIDINATGFAGTTGLMFAVLNQDKKMMDILLNAGAEKNITNDKGLDIFSLQETMLLGYQRNRQISKTVSDFNDFIQSLHKNKNNIKIRFK